MNFFPATPTEIGFRLPFGEIALTNRVRTALGRHPRPANIIVGVRPEHFEDAALIDPLERSRSLTFQVTADLVESLGADKYVYFSTAGAEAQSDQLDELAADPRSGSSLGKPFRGKGFRRFARHHRCSGRVGAGHHEAERL